MNECKQKYIEWSSENGNYCGEYDDGRLIGTDAVNEFDGWEAAWSHQQAKINELQKKINNVNEVLSKANIKDDRFSLEFALNEIEELLK